MTEPSEALRRARIAKGYLTAADAARAYGWNEVTYTAHENGTRGLRTEAAKRYARAFGLAVAQLLGIAQTAHQYVDALLSAEAGVWRDESLDQPHHQADAGIYLPDIAQGQSPDHFAVTVRDASVNKFAVAGDYAICEPVITTEVHSIPQAAFVFVERQRGSLVERTIRRLEYRGTEQTLIFWSTDSRFSEVILLPTPPSTDDAITVIGRVIARYSPL